MNARKQKNLNSFLKKNLTFELTKKYMPFQLFEFSAQFMIGTFLIKLIQFEKNWILRYFFYFAEKSEN